MVGRHDCDESGSYLVMARPVVQIIGIEQVHDVLNGLPAKLNKKFLNTAARRSAKGMYQDAVNNLSSIKDGGDKLLNQVKIWQTARTWRAGVWVGWNIKESKKDYARAKTRAERAWAFRGAFWLEHGTLGVGRRGKYKGTVYHAIQPNGWFRRAVDGNVGNVRRVFMGEVRDTINRFLNRTIKRTGW